MEFAFRDQRAAVHRPGPHAGAAARPAAGRRKQDAHAAAPSRPPPRPRRGRIFFAVLLLLATVLPGSMCAGPFQFMARSHNRCALEGGRVSLLPPAWPVLE